MRRCRFFDVEFILCNSEFDLSITSKKEVTKRPYFFLNLFNYLTSIKHQTIFHFPYYFPYYKTTQNQKHFRTELEHVLINGLY